MTAKQRQRSRKFIEENSITFVVNSVSETEIDRIGILKATMKAMNNCIGNITSNNEGLTTSGEVEYLIDGNYFIPEKKDVLFQTIVRGDNLYPQIAAASILAKEYRDEYLYNFCQEHPQIGKKYDLEKNKGYGTKQHMTVLNKDGFSIFHRRSFCKKQKFFSHYIW